MKTNPARLFLSTETFPRVSRTFITALPERGGREGSIYCPECVIGASCTGQPDKRGTSSLMVKEQVSFGGCSAFQISPLSLKMPLWGSGPGEGTGPLTMAFQGSGITCCNCGSQRLSTRWNHRSPGEPGADTTGAGVVSLAAHLTDPIVMAPSLFYWESRTTWQVSLHL